MPCLQAMVEAEAEAAQDFEEGYINDSDPSVLRFLIASRSGKQSHNSQEHLISDAALA